MGGRESEQMGTSEELIFTSSEDGLALEGIAIRPEGSTTRGVAVVWVHGLTGKFYGRSSITIGRRLAGAGFPFLSGNNRGHDFGYVLRRTADGAVVLGGGGWERFSESPADVAAWVAAAAQTPGVRGVLLAGHSLGALKVGYYQALRQDARVLGVVAASPPRGASMLRPEVLAQAERMAAAGQGQDLLPWGISPAGAGTQSAQTYLDRARTNLDVYGFHADRTPDPVVGRIRCPLFALYGTEEPAVGGAAELEQLRRNARAAARVETQIIQGADHSYSGHEAQVAAALEGWAASL